MASKIEFECPRCNRKYELALDLEAARAKRQRAKCARCGERFEIATRVDALLANTAVEDVIAEGDDGADSMAHEQVSAEPAASEAARAKHPEAGEETSDSSPAVAAGLGAQDEREQVSAWEDSASEAGANIVSDREVADGEDQSVLPQPLDWVAHAGAELASLHREPEARERDLMKLLSVGRT